MINEDFSMGLNGETGIWRKTSWPHEAFTQAFSSLSFKVRIAHSLSSSYTHTHTHLSNTVNPINVFFFANVLIRLKPPKRNAISRATAALRSSLKSETFGRGGEKNPFNDRYRIVTPTGKSNSPSSRESTCISVQPARKNDPGCPGEPSSSTILMLMRSIDLRGVLNLVGSFLLRIFHNVIHRASITPVRAYALLMLAHSVLLIPEWSKHVFNTRSLWLLADMAKLSSLLAALMMTGIDS